MKRSCIGAVTIDTAKEIFVLNTPFEQMRVSEKQIFSFLDLLQTQAKYATGGELSDIYNQMDRYYAVAMIIETLGNTPEILARCVYPLNEALTAGEFEFDGSLESRNSRLITLIDRIINNAINYTINKDYALDNDLYIWWQQNVMQLNYYVTAGGVLTEEMPTIVAVSGTEDLMSGFKRAAGAYAYTRVSAQEVASSAKARMKRAKQIEARSAISAVCPELNDIVQNNYIDSALAEVTEGGDASTFVDGLKKIGKKKARVGALTEAVITAIISLIATFVTAVTSLTVAIIQNRKNELNQNAYNALNSYPIYTTSEDDFALGDIDGDGKDDTSKILLIGAAALAACYLFG